VPAPITLCYLTSRRDSKFQWWWDSLLLQLKPDDQIQVVVVDFYADENPLVVQAAPQITGFNHVIPKPNVWQGKHRLTKDNWFAAANARNTGLCLCETDWIAYCDDLSVLTPGWLEGVRRSQQGNYVALGAYKKVRSLVVDQGRIVSFEEFPGGLDSRLRHAGEVVSCGGDWLYGCSVAGPVEAFLAVNGWPEAFDGLSFEDVCMGICLGNTNRFSFRYDKAMMTLESEEDHYKEKPMIRSDFGVSPKDKSHAALNIAKSSKWFPNYFGEEGIRGLRERVLRGEPFPIVQVPDRCWFTGRLLSELP
jgi:glycosyltransferase involved in cell wall biosynthesis